MTTPVLHPQRRCAELISANQWHLRRQLWLQTLVYGALSVLALVFVSWQLRQWVVPYLDGIWRVWQAQFATLSIALVALSGLETRAGLRAAWFEFQRGAFAALPVTAAMRERWLHHLTWRRLCRHALIWVWLIGLLHHAALPHTVQVALFAAGFLCSSAGLLLARLSFRAPALGELTRAHALQHVTRPWTWLSHPELPHVPILQVQRGQTLWWGGRARAGLFVLLLVAPMDAMAVLVPIIGMALWYGASQLEAMHRSVFDLQDLLAACPLSSTRLWRAAWRAPACLLTALLILLAALLWAVGAPVMLVLAALAVLTALAVIDLLWCIRFRAERARGQRARWVSAVLVLVILQQWPIGLLPLLCWLVWRATRGWN